MHVLAIDLKRRFYCKMSLSSATANIVLAAIVLLFGAAIHRVQSDDCSTLKPMADFNIKKIFTEWQHVLVPKPTDPSNKNFTCTTDYFYDFDNGEIHSDRMIFFSKVESDLEISYNITQDSKVPGKLTYTEDTEPPKVIVKYVLGTDYEAYLVLVHCKGDPSKFVVEVLSQDSTLSEDAEKKVNKTLEDAGIPNDLVPPDSRCKS